MHSLAHRALSLGTVFVFLALWSWAALLIDNKVILPTVGQVAELLFHPNEDLLSMGSLVTNIMVSLLRVLLGYSVAVLVAVPLGIAMGYYSAMHTMLGDFLNLFRPIPPLAWVPLVMAWFGIASLADLFSVDRGLWFVYLNNFKYSMIFIIFIGAFYPVLTSSIHGVRNVSRVFIDTPVFWERASSIFSGKFFSRRPCRPWSTACASGWAFPGCASFRLRCFREAFPGSGI